MQINITFNYLLSVLFFFLVVEARSEASLNHCLLLWLELSELQSAGRETEADACSEPASWMGWGDSDETSDEKF